MYALAIVRYRRPLEEVLVHQDAHRAYQRELKRQGLLIAAGPLDPRFGGAQLLRVPDEAPLAALDRIRDNDPFVLAGVVQYEVLPWKPVLGADDLDRL
ncbi:MAG: YciI family protein [Vicinamibacterales bacterium]